MFRPDSRKRIFAIVALLALVMVMTGVAGAELPQEVRAPNGMVAAAHQLAAEAGVEILKAGGNAVDAGVATAFAVGVVEPHASGLGGEGMIVIYLPEGDRAVVIDYRSTAPAAAAEALADSKMPGTGWPSVATPGLVAGLASALEQYGTMTLEQVLQPAIRLAEEGFPIGATLAGVIEDRYETVLNDPELAATFLDDGLPPQEGWILKNPGLASSLKKIAAEGPDAFYRGEIAQAIDAASRAGGGYITAEDLANYKAVTRWPARGNYRGYEVFSAPPPVGGATLIEVLNIVENFDLSAAPFPNAQAIHYLSESIKPAFRDYRAYVHDPDFVYVPLQEMLSKDYAKERASKVNPDKMTPAGKIQAGEFAKKAALAPTGTEGAKYESPSTTHISVIDKDRNMVAITQTISSFFGAGVMIEGTGVILNNEMANFSTDKTSGNYIAPNKRMRTSIAPTLVLREGEPFLSIGTPGAGRIVPTMAQLLVNIIDFDMGLQEAINAPRFYAREGSDVFEYEPRFPEEVIDDLKKMGYPIDEKSVRGEYDLYFGGAQGVMVDPNTGELIGAADPRRDGAAVGY
ncbi:MAG TPA: gamma-glutamyltransferase [Bacillota bacterium]|mgnify:CR=1 FL=1|nr:gamma-glutamyltransferase [Bacillota bacterium]